MKEETNIHHYFVDEAGDLTLFDKKGRILVGQSGASRFFMVGVAQVPNPDRVSWELEALRSKLRSHRRYRDIPSMQPAARKTAIAFHAKDDFSDVRNEVFRLMQAFGVKVLVAIRRKEELALTVKEAYESLGKKFNQNEIYDELVTRTFKNLLHKATANHIFFARRGKTAREEALNKAITHAKNNFEAKWGIRSDSPVIIEPAYPSESAGLQVIDYYLWALQRLYERQEEQFFNPIASSYRLIMDLDDKRNKAYGEWYSDSNPLSLSNIKAFMG